MKRLLIVDDEPFIVNGLSALIKEGFDTNLEVHKAYSADEALEWFARSAMDIVLTDICMPGMNGMELQQGIIRLWPRCKIIFLTGHDDFAYVKEAIHHGAVDYVLKTEGDGAILAAVDKALRKLDREMEAEDQLAKARGQLQDALPSLRKEFLLDALHGELPSQPVLQKQMDKLGLDFVSTAPVLLVIAGVDNGNDFSAYDMSLLLYAVQNIANEYWQPNASVQSQLYERRKLVWFVQPLLSEGLSESSDATAEECNRLQRLALGTIERIQLTCKELLKLTLSFAIADEVCSWSELPERFDRLQRLMRRTVSMGQEAIVTEQLAIDSTASREQLMKVIRKLAARLELVLESAQSGEFGEKLRETMFCPEVLNDWEARLVASHQVLGVILAFAMNEGMLQDLLRTTELGTLLEPGAFADWESSIQRLGEVGETIVSRRAVAINLNGNRFIKRIHDYIDANLSGDLSLTRLGEVVFLNPVYLSRLYKQLTGESLSDKIMTVRLAEATRRLKETEDKVQEIAVEVGFESAAYFIRFFKKTIGRTPQEYREFARR